MRSQGLPRSLVSVTVAALVLGLPAPAEIPSGQMLALLGRNDPRHPERSPILGCMALRSGVLAHVRLCGAYASTPNEAFPRHRRLDARRNCPQDAIAGVAQWLFLSPDGAILAPNELSKDPIGEIASEQRARRNGGSPVGGLGKIQALLFAASDYRHRIEAALSPGSGPPAKPRDALESADRDFREAAYRILDRPPKEEATGKERPAGAEGKASRFDLERRQFSVMLQQAVLAEVDDPVRRYPPYIVEDALLAYAWMVADDVQELVDAFGGGPLPGLLARPEPGETLPRFDRTWYQARWWNERLP